MNRRGFFKWLALAAGAAQANPRLDVKELPVAPAEPTGNRTWTLPDLTHHWELLPHLETVQDENGCDCMVYISEVKLLHLIHGPLSIADYCPPEWIHDVVSTRELVEIHHAPELIFGAGYEDGLWIQHKIRNVIDRWGHGFTELTYSWQPFISTRPQTRPPVSGRVVSCLA